MRTNARAPGDLAVVDSIGVAALACDASMAITLWNPTSQDRYGWAAQEVSGLALGDLIEDPDDLAGTMARVLKGSTINTSWCIRTKSGISLPSAAIISPLRHHDGSVFGITVVLVPQTSPFWKDNRVSQLTATYTPDGTLVDISDSLCLRLGIAANEVIGESVTSLVDPFDVSMVRSDLARAGSPREFGPFLMRFRGADGSLVPLEGIRLDSAGDTANQVIVWKLRELGDPCLANRSLEESERRYRSIVETAEEGIWILDCEGIVTFANLKMASMMGTSKDALIETSFLRYIPTSDQQWAASNLARLASGSSDHFECSLTRQDGERVEVLVSASPVLNAEGVVAGVLQMVTDISERKRVERENVRLVMEDGLTGLASRAVVVDRISQMFARRQRKPELAAVLFMDLDNFKKINDSLGHGAGDRLLELQAQRITSAVRPDDTVGRFGGDEFVVVLDHLESVAQVRRIAGRIAEVVRQPISIDGLEVLTTVSIGIAMTPSADPESIMRDADTAMYRAKERGGDCYQLFDYTLRTRALDRIDLERDLSRAISDREFRVHYQPVVLMDGHIIGFEALVRWHHPTRGLVPPGDFIPVAEATGMIVELGYWVLDQACGDLSRWRSIPGCETLTVAVNLSGRQLLEPDLVSHVAEVLDTHGLEGCALCLEITESVLMDDAHAANSALTAIHDLGVMLAVDDFGTGYSSLVYLRRFPVSALKLDRFFVAGMDKSDEDRVIVRAVIDLAHSLKLVAIAEGIETENQRQVLSSMGCDLAQGFLWSPGVPASEVEAMLLRHSLDPQESQPVAWQSKHQAPRTTGASADRKSVLLVDDSDGERSLLADHLEVSGSYRVVGEASDGRTAVGLVSRLHPDIVLLDMSMPGLNGLDATATPEGESDHPGGSSVWLPLPRIAGAGVGRRRRLRIGEGCGGRVCCQRACLLERESPHHSISLTSQNLPVRILGAIFLTRQVITRRAFDRCSGNAQLARHVFVHRSGHRDLGTRMKGSRPHRNCSRGR